MTFTKKQLEALNAKPVSYRSQNGGIGYGYQLPSECWKAGQEMANVVFVSRGNGHNPEVVAEVLPEGAYLEAIRAL